MKIRSCVANDFDRIYELLLQLWPGSPIQKDPLKKTFLRALKSKLNYYLCAVERDVVVGFCTMNMRESLWQQGWLAHIDEIVVDENHRGQGIGEALLEKAAAYAKKKGCTRVELDSAFHRKAAHRFYQQRRFEKRAYIFSKKIS
jgi:glucosamine-phosphate N-acetyltransferase